jgi:hypothetical protein
MPHPLARLAPLALLTSLACTRASPPAAAPVASAAAPEAARFPSFPAQPRAGASADFWARWSDGRAELSGYRATVNRYGELRPAELVLIYVTEPMNRRTWIKDDDAPRPSGSTCSSSTPR